MSIAMAILMVVGLMPTDLVVKSVSASTSSTFDATTLTATEDKEKIAEGTKFADGNLITFGDVVKRTDKNTGAVKSAEIGKNLTGGFELTVTGTALVTISYSSTGSANISELALINVSDNSNVANTSGDTVNSITGTTAAEVTYSLEAGTYRIISPENEYNRGTRIYTINLETADAVSETEYSFDAETLTAASDKEVISSGTKFADDKLVTFGEVVKRINTNTGVVTSVEIGKAGSSGFEFTITGSAVVTYKFSSNGGQNESEVGLVNSETGEYVADTTGNTTNKVTGTASAAQEVTYSLEAGTYKIVAGDARAARIYTINITESTSGTVSRPAWSEIETPVLSNATVSGSNISVDYTGVTGYYGADSIVFTLVDGNGNVVDTETQASTASKGTITLTANASGDYSITAVAKRDGEEDKTSNTVEVKGFALPLSTPSIISATSAGNGTVDVVWESVTEASYYTLTYVTEGQETKSLTTTETSYSVTGLTIGSEYTFNVTATRYLPAETSATSADATAVVTNEAQTVWGTITYGNGANSSNFTKVGDLNADGYVQLTAGKLTNGKLTGSGNDGKFVPASYDGLSFYYTEVPSNMNFTLRAKVTVDQWYLSNGQEAFGLMAADQLGGSGWNNAYFAAVTKTEYYVDADGNVTTDTTATKVTQKIGIESLEKTGITAENISLMEANDTDTINNNFSSTAYPLEQRYSDSSNVIGNSVNTTSDQNITEMYLTIQKNNTGYFVTYESVDGSYSVTKKYYDTEALSQIDADSVYVGFFVSRYAQATFSDVTFTTVSPENDAPAEEQPVETIETVATIDSADTTNKSTYELQFTANADGVATVYQNGEAIKEVTVTANEQVKVETTLNLGSNTFTVKYDANDNYVPGEYQVMSNYDEITISQTVTYNAYNGEIIYVSPNANGTGSKEDPADLQTALKYAQPGQTIVMMEGTYKYTSTVTIPRGTNGTEDALIYLIADPDASTRPVISGANASGHAMEIAGNYWYIQGIDVTESADGKDGIHLSGSYNTVDNVETYENGNTGLQISRLSANDADKSTWPSYNLILNCTSYNNHDKGYEDADGFAAKLTCGDGNVFDGCIAHNNADDGWDLFAKVQSGAIGVVTIKNSVAYANGYLLDGTNAGNGNGFKMGGDSMTGYHILYNCVAFDNKSKGIDSNSCPDIQISMSTSFNNEANNVALYTNTAANTDYSASGILSFRTQNTDNAENIKLVGSQDSTKVYQSTNYFWKSASGESKDASTTVTSDWFESVDTGMNYTTHVYSELPVTRNEDGTINMNGLLVLTDKAAEGTGATLNASTLTASKEITVSENVTTGLITAVAADEDVTYAVLDGDGVVVTQGESFVVRSEADFAKFVKVLVDGVEVDPSNYVVTEGSTIVTFNAAYSATLATGTHTVEIVSTDGSATATITVASATTGEVAADTATVVAADSATVAADSSVVSSTDEKTGDSAMPVVYVSLMVLAAVAFIASKKRKNA